MKFFYGRVRCTCSKVNGLGTLGLWENRFLYLPAAASRIIVSSQTHGDMLSLIVQCTSTSNIWSVDIICCGAAALVSSPAKLLTCVRETWATLHESSYAL